MPERWALTASADDDLVVEGMQPARQAGEKRRDGECEEADAVRVIAHELDALGIVPDREAHAPHRGARERPHEAPRDQRPYRDEVVDGKLRPEVEAEKREPLSAARGDAFLTAEVARQHEGCRIHELPHTERDQREDGARPPRGERPEQEPEQQSARGARERDERHRERKPVVDRAHCVDGDVAAETEIHRMTERQHARLPEQHVVGEREYHGDAHLAQERPAEVAAEPRHVRQEREGHDQREP